MASHLIAMRKYTLTGERMRQIQAVNSARKEAVAKGMSLEEAMRTITDETVPKTGRISGNSLGAGPQGLLPRDLPIPQNQGEGRGRI